MSEVGSGWASPVEDHDGDHGLFAAHRAAVRVVVQVLGADLLPVLLLFFVIYTAELLMNDGQCFLLPAAAQNTVVADTDKPFGQKFSVDL